MTHITSFISRVSEDCLRETLFALSCDPLPYRKVNFTRPGQRLTTLDEADAYIEGRLTGFGYAAWREECAVRAFGLDTSKPIRHQYASPPPDAPVHKAYNLYAERPGSVHRDEIILLLAHKDSQSWVNSPGAYDNASGTSAVIEIARVLADYPARRTLRFLCCNEEHTPWTSVTAANRARERGDNLIAIINVDSVGGKSDEDIAAGRKTNSTLYTCPAGKPFADLMAEVNDRYQIGLTQQSYERASPGDDDGSFIKAGYECAVANIGSYPYADAEYHLPGDIPERVDIPNVRMAAQATLAAVITLDART